MEVNVARVDPMTETSDNLGCMLGILWRYVNSVNDGLAGSFPRL